MTSLPAFLLRKLNSEVQNLLGSRVPPVHASVLHYGRKEPEGACSVGWAAIKLNQAVFLSVAQCVTRR